MKKLELVVLAAFLIGNAIAMPSKQEIAEARSIVAELMSPIVAEYNSKTKTAIEVADKSVEYADSAKNEAVRFLFLRGAVSYYVKGGEFGKAADTVDRIKAKVAAVPPVEIARIISSAFGSENAQKSPRLYAQMTRAQAQVKAERDVRRLASQLRKVSTDATRRQYAEALALSSNWKSAIAEFAKVSGDTGKIAQAEATGQGALVELGDFWWDYQPSYEGGESFFKEHAASFYRKAIVDGKIDGLKKTLVDQRLSTLTLADFDPSASSGNPKSKNIGPSGMKAKPVVKDKSGLVHRWSFTNRYTDSVGDTMPSRFAGVAVANGVAKLQSGRPLVFPEGTVPLPPFTVQVWASATGQGLGVDGDFIVKIASAIDKDGDSVYWRWTNDGKPWRTEYGAFGSTKATWWTATNDGKFHLFTIICEKNEGELIFKYYNGESCFGTRKVTGHGWEKSPMLILGGNVAPTYDEVRVYSRALTHAEVGNSSALGPEKLPKLSEAPVSVQQPPASSSTGPAIGAGLKQGCLHRWSFTENMVDSIDRLSPTKSKDAQVANGSVLLKAGSPLEFSKGAVPVPPFTVQVWASATGKDLGIGNDMIMKIGPSAEDVENSVSWRWTAGNRWASSIKALGASKKTAYGTQLTDGQKRLFTVVGEKAPGGLSVKYYMGDTCLGALTANPAWTKSQGLLLGGTVNAVYDEVRVYSRALSHAEVVDSLTLGPDKMP